MVRKTVKCYSKKSTIEDIGNGLFASIPIKKDQVIAEFKGKLRAPGTKLTSNRSNIYFLDEYILECGVNDLASFSNDPIKFPTKRRKLMETLYSTEPFYYINPNCKINATIKINTDLHRAFLIALCDIKPDEEIFNHYGFDYWFGKECAKLGFDEESEIEQNGFPEKMFEYPAFTSYINTFYPEYTLKEINKYKKGYDYIIECEGSYVVIYMKNYLKHMNKVSHEEYHKISLLNQLLA